MKTAYMCGVDMQFEHSMGMAKAFNTVEELKSYSQCWEECGIVEVVIEDGKILSHKWIVEQDMFWGSRKKK